MTSTPPSDTYHRYGIPTIRWLSRLAAVVVFGICVYEMIATEAVKGNITRPGLRAVLVGFDQPRPRPFEYREPVDIPSERNIAAAKAMEADPDFRALMTIPCLPTNYVTHFWQWIPCGWLFTVQVMQDLDVDIATDPYSSPGFEGRTGRVTGCSSLSKTIRRTWVARSSSSSTEWCAYPLEDGSRLMVSIDGQHFRLNPDLTRADPVPLAEQIWRTWFRIYPWHFAALLALFLLALWLSVRRTAWPIGMTFLCVGTLVSAWYLSAYIADSVSSHVIF